MIASTRHELIQKLIEASNLYPDLRFGQLLCFGASIAGDKEPGLMQDLNDEAILDALVRHIPRRAEQIGVGVDSTASSLAPVRAELVSFLEELGNHYAEWGLGQLVFKLAALAHVNVYDIEDEELLESVRSEHPGLCWFNWYTDQLEHKSTVRERRLGNPYRCPCCHHVTLCERGGFEICPVCYWEDDGQDDEDADTVRGGPNGALSLTQARENYLHHQVCDPKFVEHVRPPLPKEL
jgi:hypothetical protein